MHKLKKSLDEDLELDDYIRNRRIDVSQNPYPHFVVDDFFNEEYSKMLQSDFDTILDKGLSEEEDRSRFKPFLDLKGKYAYDGYVYTPWPGELKSLDVFFSVGWNMFISKLFKLPTSLCTGLAYHYHPVGNKTGFIHSDFVEKTFLRTEEIPNGVFFNAREPKNFKKDDPFMFSQYRRIALLYYLDNGWEKGDGGETGMYQSTEASLAEAVAPIKNRLFAFEISEKSFHAFQENKKPRSTIIQWFHASKDMLPE